MGKAEAESEVIRLSPEGGNALHCLLPQRGGIARDRRFAGALDMRDATIERGDKLAQVADLTRAVGVSLGFGRFFWSHGVCR